MEGKKAEGLNSALEKLVKTVMMGMLKENSGQFVGDMKAAMRDSVVKVVTEKTQGKADPAVVIEMIDDFLANSKMFKEFMSNEETAAENKKFIDKMNAKIKT